MTEILNAETRIKKLNKYESVNELIDVCVM